MLADLMAEIPALDIVNLKYVACSFWMLNDCSMLCVARLQGLDGACELEADFAKSATCCDHIKSSLTTPGFAVLTTSGLW